ncbi:hypothetical protein GCM10022255_062190 [Dactylosporangium darangshiense]|uniref:Uncharacterized protein n=1 Tax=Dactylosporangium darangshiense TaxID=579108 RepID=A0ABP8DFV3_9ACTN
MYPNGTKPRIKVVGGLSAQHAAGKLHALQVGPGNEPLTERRPVAVANSQPTNELIEHRRMHIVAPKVAKRCENGEEHELHDSKLRL